MEDAKLLKLIDNLKAGGPRGRTGGLGVGHERARKAVNSDLPNNALYR